MFLLRLKPKGKRFLVGDVRMICLPCCRAELQTADIRMCHVHKELVVFLANPPFPSLLCFTWSVSVRVSCTSETVLSAGIVLLWSRLYQRQRECISGEHS